MKMGFLDGIGGGSQGMLQTPHDKQFFGTPLIGIADKLSISPEQKEMVRNIAESQLKGVADR